MGFFLLGKSSNTLYFMVQPCKKKSTNAYYVLCLCIILVLLNIPENPFYQIYIFYITV